MNNLRNDIELLTEFSSSRVLRINKLQNSLACRINICFTRRRLDNKTESWYLVNRCFLKNSSVLEKHSKCRKKVRTEKAGMIWEFTIVYMYKEVPQNKLTIEG